LLFVDDWKLFGKKKEEVESLGSEVERLSRRIGLQLNEAKCTVAIKVDGRVVRHPIQRNESDLPSKFATLGDSSELTKYSGILQSGSHNESSNREAVRETVLKRVDEVLKLEASAGQLIAAINTWALGTFKYLVGIVTHQLEQLDLCIRRCLTKRRIHGGRGGINYLYHPRKLGGRGLLSVRSIARASYIRLNNYIDEKLSWLKEAFPTSRVLENIREAADAARQSVGGAETGRELATKMHTQNLNNLKTLYRAVENAIAKQPEANAELSRNRLSKEQLPAAIESTFRSRRSKCKFDMSSSDDGVWYPHTSSREGICAGIVIKSPRL
jgi:hypothetical protein